MKKTKTYAFFAISLTFGIFLKPIPLLADGTITYKINHYSKISQHFLGEDGKNNLYKVDLNYMDTYLPTLHSIKRNDLKLVGKRILPGKSAIKLARYFAYSKKEYQRMTSPKEFFGMLHEGRHHTYVITQNRFIFTETATSPKQEKNKDRLSKHYFISRLRNRLNYAGEFVPYKNPQTGDLFLVFDNASGTYRPDKTYLPNLKILLEQNFETLSGFRKEDKVNIVVKQFDQKIDKDKLFGFDENPFVE